jgi:hypothetical protein
MCLSNMRQGSTSDAGPSGVGPSGAGTPDAGADPSAPAGPSGTGPSTPSDPSRQPAWTPRRRRIPQGISIH